MSLRPLLVIAVAVVAGRAGAADPPPVEPVVISDVFSSGDGCPADTVDALVSDDGKALSVFFTSYTIDTAVDVGTGPRGDRRITKKCNVAVRMKVPAGRRVVLRDADYRGFAMLPPTAKAVFDSKYLVLGEELVSDADGEEPRRCKRVIRDLLRGRGRFADVPARQRERRLARRAIREPEDVTRCMERMESRWGKQGKNREVSLRGPYNASFDAFDLPIVETGNTGPCGGEIVLRASSVAFIKRPADDAGDALLAVDSVDGADVNDPAIGVQLDFVPCEAPRR